MRAGVSPRWRRVAPLPAGTGFRGVPPSLLVLVASLLMLVASLVVVVAPLLVPLAATGRTGSPRQWAPTGPQCLHLGVYSGGLCRQAGQQPQRHQLLVA